MYNDVQEENIPELSGSSQRATVLMKVTRDLLEKIMTEVHVMLCVWTCVYAGVYL